MSPLEHLSEKLYKPKSDKIISENKNFLKSLLRLHFKLYTVIILRTLKEIFFFICRTKH